MSATEQLSPEAVPESPPSQHDISRLAANAARLLPTQGPLDVFVHHNTLHAFEDEGFHAAAARGLKEFGAEPYLSEREYQQLYQHGRITDAELKEVLDEQPGKDAHRELFGLGTRTEIRLAILRNSQHVGPDAELRWILEESDALERFRPETPPVCRTRIRESAIRCFRENPTELSSFFEGDRSAATALSAAAPENTEPAVDRAALRLLWHLCLRGVRSVPLQSPAARYVRPRDLLLHAIGEDTDLRVHEILIQFTAAYTDQGFAERPLPNRELDYMSAFLRLYESSIRGAGPWLADLPAEASRLLQNRVAAKDVIEESLRVFDIPEEAGEEFLTRTMLALPGWFGIVRQLESAGSGVSRPLPEGSLTGMLAVRLILDAHAVRHIGRTVFGKSLSAAEVLRRACVRLKSPEPLRNERTAFMLFQAAQLLGWTPDTLLLLTDEQWTQLAAETTSFDGVVRRLTFHEAFEQRFRRSALTSISLHAAGRPDRTDRSQHRRPVLQLVTCIDDREESFRRHLEEVLPTCETFGAAGFFAVAMYYRGAAETTYVPLCPDVVTPLHYVREDVGYTFEGLHRTRSDRRRRLGIAGRLVQSGSRTFLGGMLASFTGAAATAPLVTRVLFPRLTSRIRSSLGSCLRPPPVTNLQLERFTDPPGPTHGHIGYTTDEMAAVVMRLLRDIGLTNSEHFSRLVILCGHGSSSLNNPHESAYCCGACAGKRGGPNARAFAQMANDRRVRSIMSTRGISVPDDTWFVGAYHNTCDDSVVWYDLDRLPASHRTDFDSAREAIEEARRRNAHERCRRFSSADLTLTAEEALRHVESRAEDISQVRPEYNHATNALCIVGRRCRTRGLFLDRRAFLTSYDPTQDDEEHSVLLRILSAAIPVCAGISLEYYFSRVDPDRYGAGSKLPHNVVSLLGVMEGTSGDLRTGLYRQMTEIHDPVRLTVVVETTPEAMLSVMRRSEKIRRLVEGNWIHLAVMSPDDSTIRVFIGDEFRPHTADDTVLQVRDSSLQCYEGCRDNRPFFSVAIQGGEQ